MIESVQKQLEHSLSVLAVESSHSWDDIEKQYRQLIQRWHPDRNSDENGDAAQSKFIEINVAYKNLKEYYRKNGAIPRRLSTQQAGPSTKPEGPLLGSIRPVKAKRPLHKNTVAWGVAISLVLVAGFGTLLWSLDSRLANNNRDRAKVEKTDTLLQTENNTQTQATHQGDIKQSTNEVEQ